MNNFFDKRLKQITTITLALLAAFILVKTIGAAIDISQKNKTTNNNSYRITFNGSAEVAVIPDNAEFIITIREIDKNIAIAQQEMAKKANKAIDLFSKMGIEKKDIQTKNYTTNPKYSFNSVLCPKEGNCRTKEPVLTGYEARESISIKLRDLTKSGDVLTQIANLEIAEVRGPIFTISDDSKFKIQAQAQAIADAKSKAAITAKNLGITLGDIVSFSETPQFKQYSSEISLNRVKSLSSPKIEAGEEIIRSIVYISYEIK